MSFSQALSGLNAQSENLKILSNNIANSQTVGFKSSGALFADVFAGANSQVGLGVSVADVRQDFTAGDLENTGRTLDLAVAGEGFYRVEQVNGEAAFTRNGEFTQDSEGFLVNAANQRLTGYGLADPNEPFSEVVPGGAPQALRIPQDDIPANATTEVNATFNLNASTPTGANTTQAATVLDENGVEQTVNYHFSNSYTIYDSLGNERNVTSYFTKNATVSNKWDVEVALDGVIGGFDGNIGSGGNHFTTEFDTNGGLSGIDATTGATSVALSFNDSEPTNPAVGTPYELDGAENLAITLELRGTTQYNNDSVQNTLSQDGYTSGSLAGLEITNDGRVIRLFTNEERRDAGQIVLANFANVEGLQPIGDNAWRETNASGVSVIGTAGTGVYGTIESGVLENSNVELASQLVDTIVAQRAYQANSTTISTQDEILQTIINL
ncbi:flagellar hook protein FlgE [Halomonas vilamensis]|uniref:Flagellar hook protein FlgE n=1 Tax=Vreelandella vilamensis TaxID=531309 RepID=A0ABU1H385_9GAMM|nr:flagellar hook protein FlgE [Halomonas vilamensis]MDR5898756.1 flagellar hook protein FlgE [Halomonas vilamensis]